MEPLPLRADLPIAELLARWPQTAQVFLRYRMACVGCTMAPFDTLADAAMAYNLDLARLLGELQQVIQSLEEGI